MSISFISLRHFMALLLATALSGLDSAAATAAGTITGAVGATVNSGGNRAGTRINGTLNQNGLFTPYVSDATPFQPYVPTNNPNNRASYHADVFALTPVTARYVRFDMSNCPQPNSAFPSCSIHEAVFRDPDAGTVPEPTTLAVLGIGLVSLGMRRPKWQSVRETGGVPTCRNILVRAIA